MNAHKFVKDKGWDEAKLFVNKNRTSSDVYFEDLKRLVQFYDLVQGFGGLKEAKAYLSKKHIFTWDALDGQLSQAIEDMELCQ